MMLCDNVVRPINKQTNKVPIPDMYNFCRIHIFRYVKDFLKLKEH